MSDGGDEAVAGVATRWVDDLRLHRTPVLLAVVVVVGLARGPVLSNGKGVLFILGLLGVVAGMGFTVRGLWRQAHRVSWTSGGSLVLHTLGGPRTARLEPPIAVHRSRSSAGVSPGPALSLPTVPCPSSTGGYLQQSDSSTTVTDPSGIWFLRSPTRL